MEEWKKIDGFPHYEVSDMGNIKSLYSGKILKPSLHWGGYLMVNLSENGKIKTKLVHRLVAEAFVENPQGKPSVDHINMNKQDNRAVNLRWQTQKEQLNNEDQDYKTNQLCEKAKEIMRKYREENKEKLKEYGKVYREENKEKLKEYDKVYREENKEKLKEYREANKEKLKEYVKVYREENKEKRK